MLRQVEYIPLSLVVYVFVQSKQATKMVVRDREPSWKAVDLGLEVGAHQGRSS